MTKWKPAKRVPMLSNGPRLQMGVAPVAAPLLASLARWVLPWLAVSGGVALTSYVTSKALPTVPINTKNLGLASALIGGGATAYFVSENLPEQHKAWAYAAAVAGIASGMYFLFQEPPPAPPPPTTGGGNIQPLIAPAEQMPNDPPGWLAQKLILQFDPQQSLTGGLSRNMGMDQPYAFAIRNQDPYRTAKFYAGLDIRDSDGKVVFKSKPDAGIYTSKLIELGPNASSSFELLSPSQWFWLPQTVTVVVNLYRNRDDQTPFMVSEPLSIKMTYPGGGIMGSNVAPIQVELHDERDPQHVIGCKKCKRKKRSSQQVSLPNVPLT